MAGICDQAEMVMFETLWMVLVCPLSWLRPKHQLALEILALRHQITVLRRQTHKPKLRLGDRLIWILLQRCWADWKRALLILQPETVIGWQRGGLRVFWRWKSRRRLGRPGTDRELIQLIRRMWAVNPTWGSPRLRDEAEAPFQTRSETWNKRPILNNECGF